jgi:thioesterase domain-containing protein
MTRTATDRGAHVDFFGVLDTNFAERAWPVGIWFRHMLRRAGKKTLSAEAKMPDTSVNRTASSTNGEPSGRWHQAHTLLARISVIGDRLRRVWQRLEHRFITDPSSQAFLKADPYYIPNLPPKFQRVRDAAILMAACYRPTYYDGELHLFQAEFGDALACNPVLTWSRLVRKVILRPTPGDHMTMLIPPHVAAVAAEVSATLNEIEQARRERTMSVDMGKKCDRGNDNEAPQGQADRH